MSVRIHPINENHVQLSVCEDEDCKPIAGGTGIYRRKDLETRKNDLLYGAPEDAEHYRLMQRRLNIWGPAGVIVMAFAIGTDMYLNSRGIFSPTQLYLTTAVAFLGAVPTTLWFMYPGLIKPSEIRVRTASGKSLSDALEENFDKSSERAFRENVRAVSRALNGVETVTECEAATS